MNESQKVRLRVTVSDAYDAVTVTTYPNTTIADIRVEALARLVGGVSVPERYVVKYRGGPVDEHMTIRELAPPDGAALVLLPGRREPVR